MKSSEKKGTEGFYLDKNGEKQDAAFHEEILNNPEADLFCRQMSAREWVEGGRTMEQACRIFGVEPWTDTMTVDEWRDLRRKARAAE